MSAEPIMLSTILANPKKYNPQLQLLFNKLESGQKKITTLNEIMQLDNKQCIQLDQRICPHYIDNADNSPNYILKFDIYAKEKDIEYCFADHDLSEVKYVMRKNGSQVVIKPKQRLINIVNNAAKAARNKAFTSIFYPFKARYINEEEVSLKSNAQLQMEQFIHHHNELYPEYKTELPDIYSSRLDFGPGGSKQVEGAYTQYMTEKERASNNTKNSSAKSIVPHNITITHIQTPMPKGILLSNVISPCNHLQLNEKLQIMLSLLDEIETLQAMGIRHLHLSLHNIFYDAKEKRITILNFHHAQQTNDELSKIPSLSTYLAPEVIKGYPHKNSDNYSAGIIFAQLFGITILQMQKLKFAGNKTQSRLFAELAANNNIIMIEEKHDNFGQIIADEMKKNIFTPSLTDDAPLHLLTKVIAVTQKLLCSEPNKRIEVTEAKKAIFEAASSKTKANYHIHDTHAKQTFFKTVDVENGILNDTLLMVPLYNKISSILNDLPWQKASRFGRTPMSIQFMRDILNRQDLLDNPKSQLKAIQSFCKKNANLAGWKKKLRGRHDITDDLITILAELTTTSVPHLVNKLDTLHNNFNIEFGIQVHTASPVHQYGVV